MGKRRQMTGRGARTFMCVSSSNRAKAPRETLHHLCNSSSEPWKIYPQCNKENGKNRTSQVKAGMEGQESTCSFIHSNGPSGLSARQTMRCKNAPVVHSMGPFLLTHLTSSKVTPQKSSTLLLKTVKLGVVLCSKINPQNKFIRVMVPPRN